MLAYERNPVLHDTTASAEARSLALFDARVSASRRDLRSPTRE